MENKLIEKHPLGFFLPEKTRLLMLGSFPPPHNRWSMEFYYPNFNNDMWRILGIIFYNDKDFFLETPKKFSREKAVLFCEQKKIGIGDTAEEIIRLDGNASDNSLKVVKAANLVKILSKIPNCKALAITGQKSMDTLIEILPQIIEPKVGMYSEFVYNNSAYKLYRMPSSSRAYPKPLPEKAEIYRKMFKELDMI